MQVFGVPPLQKHPWGSPPKFWGAPPYLLLIGLLESVTQPAQAGTQLLLRTKSSPGKVTIGDSLPPAPPTLGGSLVVPILRGVKLTWGGKVRLHTPPPPPPKAAGRAALPVLPAPGWGGHKQLPTPPPRGPPKHEGGGHALTRCLLKRAGSKLALGGDTDFPPPGYGGPPPRHSPWAAPGVPRVPQR